MVRIELVPRANRLALPPRAAAPEAADALLRRLTEAARASADDPGDTIDTIELPRLEPESPAQEPATEPEPAREPGPTIEIEPADSDRVTVEIGTPPPTGGPSGTPHETAEILTPPPLPAEPEGGDRSAEAPRRRDARVGVPLQERLRKLTPPAQRKLARTGELSERVALERICGKDVWEPLLRNPKLTPPEVARIARMGTLPVPLIERIVGNKGWLKSGQVRRALLANRRLRGALLHQVLRATPRSELKIMPKQTAYPSSVREAAAALLR